ncbi:MAG: pitrilysin family protein [Candidatus Eisenbacteria bacterium]
MKPAAKAHLRARVMRSLLLAAAVLALTGAALRLPAPRTRTLPNGLRVVVFHRPGLPVVQTQLQVPAGISAESRGHAGLAFLTSQLLRQGTTSRSAADLATELDTLGATLAVSVTRDAGQVAAGCRTSEFESLLELVSDAVINPLFSEDAFQATRRQVAGQLGQQAQSPIAIADERVVALAFGDGHPYAHGSRGTMESLLGSTREQVREFHRDHWRPDRSVLVIAGDIDPERAFASAAEWFGRWGGKALPDSARGAFRTRKGTMLFDLPGSPATEVRAALIGPGRGTAEYPGWVVAREALEGGLLPAGAHAVLQPAREASLLVVSASARPESAAVVAGRIQRALQSLAAPLPAATLKAARQRAADGWPMSLETLGQLISSWLAGDVAGAPSDHLDRMSAQLAAAAPADAGRAVSGGYTLLLAGPAERMKGRLGALGVVDTVTIANLSPVAGSGLQVSEEQRRRGRQLVQAAVTAHGGAAKLAAAKVSEIAAELNLSVAGQTMTGELRTLRVDPDRMVNLTRFLEFEHRQVLDRKRGWTLSTAGDSASMLVADSTTILSFRAVLDADLVHVLRAASAPGAAPYSAGKGVVDKKPVDLLEFASADGFRNRLALDPVTHRIVTVESLPTPQGVWRERRHWSEYVQVEGVWWPREEVRELDGERVSRLVMRQIIVNDPVDTTLFRRPLVVRGQIRGLEE